MTDEKRKFRRRKLFLTLFHIIFVSMSVFGISAMYLNSNYGKGVKWIYEDAYEDSPQFDKQLTEDIDRIFTYVGYKDMFETDGKLDMTAYCRALDFGCKAYVNLVMLHLIQKEIAEKTGIPCGKLILIVKSAHFYLRDREKVLAIIEKVH